VDTTKEQAVKQTTNNVPKYHTVNRPKRHSAIRRFAGYGVLR
jgi:hypothetical protein